MSTADFTSIWGDGSDLQDWSAAQIEAGWTSRIPRYQYDNNWLNRQCRKIQYLYEYGIPQWSDQDTYSVYSLVIATDFEFYICKTANTNQDPTTDSLAIYWVPFSMANATTKEVRQFYVTTDELTYLENCGWKRCNGQDGLPDAESVNAPLMGWTTGGMKSASSTSISYAIVGSTDVVTHDHTFSSGDTVLEMKHIPDHKHSYGAIKDMMSDSWKGQSGVWFDGLASELSAPFTSANALNSTGNALKYITGGHNHGMTTVDTNLHAHTYSVFGETASNFNVRRRLIMMLQYEGF